MKVVLIISVKIILVILLLLCLLDWPYGYYMFVRAVSMIGFGLLAFDAFSNKQAPMVIIYLGLLLLFQPLQKITLGRDLWNIVDVLVAVGLIITIFIPNEPKESD
jgi:hypothetical protein